MIVTKNFKNIVISEIPEIISVYSQRGRHEKITNRKCYGISFCENGQITYTHGNEKIVSDKSCVIFHPKGESYTLDGNKDGLFSVINFNCTNFLTDKFIKIPIENNSLFLNDFKFMKSLNVFGGNKMKIMSILYNMLHRLFEVSETTMLSPAIRYIETNYHKSGISNSELASLCGISEVYFRRIFQKQFNTTPKQFLIDLRLNHAKELLSEGKLKISAIAEKCGFSNPYHFCRSFKTQFGITPTEYMVKNRIYKI